MHEILKQERKMTEKRQRPGYGYIVKVGARQVPKCPSTASQGSSVTFPPINIANAQRSLSEALSADVHQLVFGVNLNKGSDFCLLWLRPNDLDCGGQA